MKLRGYSFIALLLIICSCLFSVAQGPPGPIVAGGYLRAQNFTGSTRNLIGLTATDAISIDPGGLGSTFGGVVTASGGFTGSLNTAVTVSELSTNLRLGYIPLNLGTARIISSNTIQNTVEGGVPDGNTSPSLLRVNGATDKQTRIAWAASNSAELQFDVLAIPADFDGLTAWTVRLSAAMAGTTDTPTVAIGVWRGVGGADIGGATLGITGTTVGTYFRGVTGDTGTTTGTPVSIQLVPGTHTTDILYLYAAWIEYTRKN